MDQKDIHASQIDDDQPLAPPRRKSIKVSKGGMNSDGHVRKSVRPVAILKPKIPVKPKLPEVKKNDDPPEKRKKNPPRPPLPPSKTRSIGPDSEISKIYSNEKAFTEADKSQNLLAGKKNIPKPKPAPRPKAKRPTPIPRKSINKENSVDEKEAKVWTEEVSQETDEASNADVSENLKGRSLTHPLLPETGDKEGKVRTLSHPLRTSDNCHKITPKKIKKQKYNRSLSQDNLLINAFPVVKLKRSKSVDYGLNEGTERTVIYPKYENIDPKYLKFDSMPKKQRSSNQSSYENVTLPSDTSIYSIPVRRPSLPDYKEPRGYCGISSPSRDEKSTHSCKTFSNQLPDLSRYNDNEMDSKSCPSTPIGKMKRQAPSVPYLGLHKSVKGYLPKSSHLPPDNEISELTSKGSDNLSDEGLYSVPPSNQPGINISSKSDNPSNFPTTSVGYAKYTPSNTSSTKNSTKKTDSQYYNVVLQVSPSNHSCPKSDLTSSIRSVASDAETKKALHGPHVSDSESLESPSSDISSNIYSCPKSELKQFARIITSVKSDAESNKILHEAYESNYDCPRSPSEAGVNIVQEDMYVDMLSSTYEQVDGNRGNKNSAYEDINLPLQDHNSSASASEQPPRPPPPRIASSVVEKGQLDTNIYTTVDSLEHQSNSGQRVALSDEVSCSESESDEEYENDDMKQLERQGGDKLFYIANEILTTEKSFVCALKLICEDFGGSLKGAMAKNSKLLPDGCYSEMFLNIEQIYELDKKFLQELEERMQNWDLHKRIGDLIREYGHFLKMYTTYIKGYDNAMSTFLESCSTNMKFMQLVSDFERSKKAQNMKLSSYMLKPIQRIPSYRLLLLDYLDHLPEDSVDYKDIKHGVVIVSDIAKYINESMKEGEKFQEVLRIQCQIVNAKDIVKPGRCLLKEGTLQKLSRKELQPRTFILFTDVLLYCSSFGHNQLKLIMEMPLAGMIVQHPDSQDLTNEFTIISTRRSFLVNASSPKEREDWIAALTSAIEEVTKKRETFTLKRVQNEIGNIQNLSSGPGDIAPPWIPDSRATMCQICTSAFSVYNRRHHCRACGKVVCSNCSAYEAPLKYMDNDVARVCEKCYTFLLEKFQQVEQEMVGDALEELRAKFKNGKKKRKKPGRIRPSTLTEVGAQEEGIETSGFLRSSKKGKKEKRYWFVLKDHVLYMYKASSDPAASSTTPVLGYKVDVAGNWDEGDFVFHLTHPGVKEPLIFKAENRTAAERWLHCLLKATALSSS